MAMAATDMIKTERTQGTTIFCFHVKASAGCGHQFVALKDVVCLEMGFSATHVKVSSLELRGTSRVRVRGVDMFVLLLWFNTVSPLDNIKTKSSEFSTEQFTLQLCEAGLMLRISVER